MGRILMNIFVLDSDPRRCAEMHCDKHVVKMILESAQMICTTHHLHPSRYEKSYDIPYKQTHTNHPCNKWLRDSLFNYYWLFKLTEELNNEYKYRYDKDVDHKSWTAIKNLPIPDLPVEQMTPWARAMSDEYKIGDRTYTNVIKSYHNYYINGKQHILKYTKREQPAWLCHA